MEARQCLKAECKIKALKQHLSDTRKQILVFQHFVYDHLFPPKLFLHFIFALFLFNLFISSVFLVLTFWSKQHYWLIILDSNSPWWAHVCLSALIQPIMSSTMSLHSNPFPDWQRCWNTQPTRSPKAFQTFLLPHFCWIAGVLLPFYSFILM